MRESNQNIHIEALHYLSGIPFDCNLGIRANKVNVLETLRFSKGKNTALIREFDASRVDGTNEVQEYLRKQLKHDRFISMLFNGMGWESIGGSPVVYVMSEEDMNKKLEFNNGKLVSAHSQEGKNFEVNSDVRLQTYSRQQSMEMTIDGLDNYSVETRIKAGGGFRLQLDDISLFKGKLKFTFSSVFSFNDMGSRVLALSSQDDKSVPRFSNTFQVEVVDGKLVYSTSYQKDVSEVQNAIDLSEILIGNLFDTDGTAISLLYRYLLNVRPSLKTHQLEGIFSITSNGISTEVIDFDGIDTFDLKDEGDPQLNPAERLVAAHLRLNDYTLTNSQRLITFIQYRKDIQKSLIQIANSEILPDQIKEVIKKIDLSRPENIFDTDTLGSAKLARLLKVIMNSKDNEANQCLVRQFQTISGNLFIISIKGFDMAFLQKGCQLVDFTDIKKQRSILQKMLKTDIIDVYFSYTREGD